MKKVKVKTAIHKALQHLKTILVHKYWVFVYMSKYKMPIRGLLHDISKFSIVELKNGFKYYTEGLSPINIGRTAVGYSMAWQHHRKHNPHHLSYWVDFTDDGIAYPIPMPYKYCVELVCDYMAAGRAYSGKGRKELPDSELLEQELEIWNSKKEKEIVHPLTARFVTDLLEIGIPDRWFGSELIRSIKTLYKIRKVSVNVRDSKCGSNGSSKSS